MADQEETKTQKALRYGKYTARGIIATIGLYILWDLYVFIRFGGHATESTQVGTWFYQKRWVLFLWGTLTGHLIVSSYDTITESDIGKMLFALSAGVAFGIFITKGLARISSASL